MSAFETALSESAKMMPMWSSNSLIDLETDWGRHKGAWLGNKNLAPSIHGGRFLDAIQPPLQVQVALIGHLNAVINTST
jgi:hypothetical protein